MADWYVKPSTSHSASRNGTSEALAFGTWAEITWASIAAGDTLWVCGAFNFSVTTAIGAHNGTSSNPVIIRGDSANPGAINITVAGQVFTPRSNTVMQGLEFSAASRCILTTGSLTYFTLRNCRFNGGTNCIFTLSAATGHNHTDILVDNCYFTGGGDSSSLGTGAAISWFASGAGDVTTLTRITLTNNQFINCNTGGTSRGVISFRTEEDVDATSIITDLVINNNTFKLSRGYSMEAVDGHSFGAASPQFGLWKGFKFNYNIIENQTVDNSRALGGGCSAFGFSESSASFGFNYITHNVMNNIEGQCGGINVAYGCFIIQHNTITNVKTYTIDGCGILVDDGIRRTTVSHNYIYNALGVGSATNSGAGIMFLNTASTLVFGNIVDTCRYGLYYGSPLPSSFTWAYNNTFLNCQQAGILFGAVPDRTSSQVYNNVFTGTNRGTNYSVQVTGGTAWTNENYNCFYNFATAPLNHTLGANSMTINPQLRDELYPLPNNPLIHLGRYVLPSTDYNGASFHNPPTIGAVEYTLNRGSR